MWKTEFVVSRYVWEIVVGAHNAFIKEESMVTLDLEDGMDCDVIGDVHGTLCFHATLLDDVYSLIFRPQANSTTCSTCSL